MVRVGLCFRLLCDWNEDTTGSRVSFLENRPVATSLACLEELASTLGPESVFVVINNSSSARAGTRERKWIDFRGLWSLGLAKENVLVGLDAAAAANLDIFLSSDPSTLTSLRPRGKTLLCLFQRPSTSSERTGVDEEWFRCMKIIAGEFCPQLRLRPFDTWMDPSSASGPSSSPLPSSATTSSSSYSSSSGKATRSARRPHHLRGRRIFSSSSPPPSSFCCFCEDEGEADCSLCVLDRDLHGRPVTLFRVLRGVFLREADEEQDDEGEGGPVDRIHLHLQDHGGGLVYDSTSWTWWDLLTHLWLDEESDEESDAVDVVHQKQAMRV